MRLFRRNKKGFTLIEVIVIIGILAILSSIVAVSMIAILRKSEKNTVTSTLNGYWKITVTSFNQINKGFTTVTSPTKDFLKTRLNTTKLSIGTSDPTSISEGYIYIKYEKNPKSVYNKYKVVCIYMRYKDNYYYTTDGISVTGPKESI